jgi:hypothetical protein
MFGFLLLLLETHHGSLVVVDGRRIHHLCLVQCCEQLLFHSVILVDLYSAHGGVQLGLTPTR